MWVTEVHVLKYFINVWEREEIIRQKVQKSLLVQTQHKPCILKLK